MTPEETYFAAILPFEQAYQAAHDAASAAHPDDQAAYLEAVRPAREAHAAAEAEARAVLEAAG